MIATNLEQGRERIARLCDYFRVNQQKFVADGVKEAHVRQTLIDPLFEALGWDVRNTGRIAPQYREVIPEDSVEVQGRRKAPDYTFRVGAQPKFFAEAKKCGADLGENAQAAFQLRRYGWSAKMALSLLTDFQALAIYDCTLRPRPTDKASHARMMFWRWEEYPDRWHEVWELVSREAVWSGAFDHFAASKRKRGTSEVDIEFLKEIDGWREELARGMALRNPDLSSRDLNAGVQRTIDRVVFLRMAEDRGLEPFQQLLTLSEEPDIYARFMRTLCRRADEKYNSGLFHFQVEPGIDEPPDRLTPALAVDDKVFGPILQSLYFAHGSPYDFGVMPVEILGTVYERFLGKVIRLTQGHQAKVEEKPEVRKAGGVFYTPSYIVDYIVKQTVGSMIEGKSPAQLAGGRSGRPLRVLDMACGSGSFLLGAYQCLLDHCLAWYLDRKPRDYKKVVYQLPNSDQWRLTIQERKRILTTHIFGVDIDAQAVEVSKLSLLLKALEGETDATLALQRQLQLFEERALPNLSGNIKCGNSLIDETYFQGRLIPDREEMRRVNAFDWRIHFPDAMADGGFDCVIGNPPYIRIQTMKEWAPIEVDIYKELFASARQGNYDIYVVFVERGLQLLKRNGRLGFICPHKFFNAKYGEGIRELVAAGRHLSHVVHFGDQQVFDGATTYTCLLFLDRAGAETCRFVKVRDLEAWRERESNGNGNGSSVGDPVALGLVPASKITAAAWNFHVGDGAVLYKKLLRGWPGLGEVADIFVGLQTSADRIYIVKNTGKTKGRKVVVTDQEGTEWVMERGILKPFLSHTTVSSFEQPTPGHWLIFPYELKGGKATLFTKETMERRFPGAWEYLYENRKALRQREQGKARHKDWYGYIYRKNLVRFDAPKLIVQVIATHGRYALDEQAAYFTGGGNGPYYGIRWQEEAGGHDLRYLQALLASPLLDFYLRKVSSPFRGGYWSYGKRFIEQLPIRLIDFDNPRDAAAHERMVLLVGERLQLGEDLRAADSEELRTVIRRQMLSHERAINQLVFELYNLTPAEIAVVEAEQRADAQA